MNDAVSTHVPLWRGERPLAQRFEPLQTATRTGVLVIGAGITGLSTALELLYRGYQVTVCEALRIGSGTTAGSSAHLDVMPDSGIRNLVETVGADQALETIRLRRSAIDAIESRTAGGCNFARIPGYSYTEHRNRIDSVRGEYDALRSIGGEAEWVDDLPLPIGVGGFRIDRLARFNPFDYLHRLADLVTEAGGRIFEGTTVNAPAEKNPHSLKAGGVTIAFDHVVCATHSSYTGMLAQRVYVQTPPYQSYVLAARVANPPGDGLFWDDDEPYHYIRRGSTGDENLIVVGGCDHRTGAGSEPEAFAKLERYTRERFEVQDIVYRWSAELFEPTDGLPIIGKAPGTENIWLATGLSGIGLTWGTVAGWMIADQILGRDCPLQAELSPERFRLSSLANLVTEQSGVALNYARRFLPSKAIDPDALRPGEGAVGKVDGEQVAVCRDAQGCLHRHSPLCTHMGGVVRWNVAEQTWDCPVHGGRFAADGSRIYGPPEERLAPVEQSRGAEKAEHAAGGAGQQ